MLFYLEDYSLNDVRKFRTWLHYLLRNLNIQKSWSYVAKYYLSVRLYFMGVVFEYPLTIQIDNIGEIFILDNTLVYQGMNHI